MNEIMTVKKFKEGIKFQFTPMEFIFGEKGDTVRALQDPAGQFVLGTRWIKSCWSEGKFYRDLLVFVSEGDQDNPHWEVYTVCDKCN